MESREEWKRTRRTAMWMIWAGMDARRDGGGGKRVRRGWGEGNEGSGDAVGVLEEEERGMRADQPNEERGCRRDEGRRTQIRINSIPREKYFTYQFSQQEKEKCASVSILFTKGKLYCDCISLPDNMGTQNALLDLNLHKTLACRILFDWWMWMSVEEKMY